MSTKNVIPGAEISSQRPNRRNHPALFVISIILLATVVVALITVQSRNSQAASVPPVVYSDALAMQYAQPWLDKVQAVAPVVQYSHALEMQYAQPWLEKQLAETPSTGAYHDFLALFYAQPRLEEQQSRSCDGRLDEMYACQYGNWQPQK